MDFCKCGSIIINEKCTNAHCQEENQKCKSWIVDGTAIKFKKAISYEEASGIVKRLNNVESN